MGGAFQAYRHQSFKNRDTAWTVSSGHLTAEIIHFRCTTYHMTFLPHLTRVCDHGPASSQAFAGLANSILGSADPTSRLCFGQSVGGILLAERGNMGTEKPQIQRFRSPFPSAIFMSDASAMRSLEKWQKTATLEMRGSARCRIALSKSGRKPLFTRA